MHKFNEGLYFPASINPIVFLETPTILANSSCDKSFSTLASFKLIFFKEFTYNYSSLFFIAIFFATMYIPPKRSKKTGK